MKIRSRLEQTFVKISMASGVRRFYLKNDIIDFASQLNNQNLILDIGGGKSPYTSYFDYKNYISLDISPDARADITGDVRNLPFKNEIADAVICTEVLEHVPDTSQALEELNRVLKKGSYLIMTTPLIFGVHGKQDFFRWTEKALKELCNQNGFAILELRKNGGIFSSIGMLLQHIPEQIFAPYTNRKNLLKYGFLFLLYLLLVPLTRLFIILDFIDTKKNFTTGYSILAKKDNATIKF